METRFPCLQSVCMPPVDDAVINEIHVRDAIPEDIAFLVDCNVAMALETEHRQLDPLALGRGVAGVFERRERGFYLVAELGGHAVGSLLVTREWSDWRNGDWWWLQSVYVVPEARRIGVFSALHEAVAQRARRSADAVGLRLYVEHGNHAAQKTYLAFGMHKADYLMMERASDS